LAERVDVLTKSRSGVMEAMLLERRRIERDLHDGAQQRLVALAMDLGMAKEKLRTDPAAAQRLVESSHEEAKRVLSDLRDLVRGIYPAVLTDRGLDAAISSVAGRSPVLVTVDVELPERPPEAVEATAYFVVVEALTNVAKHSGASEAKVWVRRVNDRLAIEVTDNGAGGADTKAGTGLGGLADRIAALDGQLTIDSPVGGPTRVRAEIPIGP
jgi:signal transduction histidine kinase